MTAVISDTVIPGNHIKINGYTFEQVSRAPRGRRITRKLINEEKQERIVIYS
jgi:hypothetical protein